MSATHHAVLQLRRTLSSCLEGQSFEPSAFTSQAAVLIKPEALRPDAVERVLHSVLLCLKSHDVLMGRWAVHPGSEYLQQGSLVRHYPRLHRVAAVGLPALTPDALVELTAVAERLALDPTDVLTALGALAAEPYVTAVELNERLRVGGVFKLGAGSYVSPVQLAGRTRLVLNGFVPAMSLGYASSEALVVVLEVGSNREIADLRSSVLGALDPAAAAVGTLRRTIYEVLSSLESCLLSEGRNGIHLSASHLEGMYQVGNYLGNVDGQALSDTSLGADLMRRGISPRQLHELSDDPNTLYLGRLVAPFALAEGLGRLEVLDLVTALVRERSPGAP